MEPLTTGIGFAISKAVFKAWFKDNEFLSSAGESANDLLKSTITDRRSRSAAERHLQRISERAADSLEPLIDFEWGDLGDVQKREAINVVQNAIDGLNINSQLMSSLDFDTNRLVALLSSNLLIGGLDSDAARLAHTLAHEAAQLISDLASSLPEFHKETFADILRRETEIISRLERVFEEVELIRRSSASESASGAATIFEQTYRRSVARNLDQIELFGLDSGLKQSSRQHNLSTAYISLSVTAGVDVPADVEDGDTDSDVSDSPDRRTVFAVRAEEAANLSQYTVIKGEAGSGKTTLLQSLAVRCAKASFDETMLEWNTLIPFFVRLRALSGDDLPTPEQLPALSAPNIAGTMPNGWVHTILKEGRGLILIDGMDEISPERRDDTRRWVEALVKDFDNCRVVVTSRPTAISDTWLVQKGFKQLELLAMTPDDVSAFVDHWHDAVAAEEQDLQRKEDVLTLIAPLKERIRTDRALRELAATPLLCAMLCAMNRDRKQVLPTNRIALYEAAVQMILHGRDEERRIRVSADVRLEFETKKTLLQEVAFWMMQNGASMADQWRVEDFVSSLIPGLTRIPHGVNAKAVVSSLIQRSGIIRSPISGKVDFVHNAFKEYLCALAVSSGDRFGFLESVLDNDAWREVAVLAAAITDERRRAAFIAVLLDMGDASLSARATHHLLAVRCLESCTQLDPSLQNEIRKRLQGLAAPTTFTEARALSAAGDMALELVKYSPHHYAKTAASCVRALRLIGTQDAQTAIVPFAMDRRSTVAKEVMAAWPFFDIEDYAKNVLAFFKGVYSIVRVDHKEYLKGVRYLKSAPGLTVYIRKSVIPEWAVKEISQLGQLSRLHLVASGALDLSDILGLSELSYLSVSVDDISNVGIIGEFYNLRSLSLSGTLDGKINIALLPKYLSRLIVGDGAPVITENIKNDNVIEEITIPNSATWENVAAFTKMERLRKLRFPLVTGPQELEQLLSSANLEDVYVNEVRDIERLPNLGHLKRLRSLNIGRSEALQNVDSIVDCHSLRTLHIRDCPNLENLSRLSALHRIENLSLNVSSKADLSFIKHLPNLRQLRLAEQNYHFAETISKAVRTFRIGSSISLPHSF